MVAFFSPPPFMKTAAPFQFLGDAYNAASATTQTFANFNFGPASSTRRIIIGVHNSYNGGASDFTSVTVGGVTATLVIKTNVSIWLPLALYIVDLPSASSGNVVVVQNVATDCAIAAWAVHDLLSSSPFSTGTSTNAATMSVSLNVPANGYVFAFSYNTLGSPAWAGADTAIGGSNLNTGYRHSAASAMKLAAQSGRTVSCAWGSNNNNSRLAAFSIAGGA